MFQLLITLLWPKRRLRFHPCLFLCSSVCLSANRITGENYRSNRHELLLCNVWR